MSMRTTLMVGVALASDLGTQGWAEQTALVLYESKGMGVTPRREGLAFVEVDPEAPDFGQVLAEIPLPSDMIAHHIFYNPARDRA